jgi:hypothetical protein
MVKHLRFYAMDPGYVLHVSQWQRIQKAGLETKVLRESLAYAPLARRSVQQLKNSAVSAPNSQRGRIPGGEVSWVMKRTFSAIEIASVASDKPLEVTVGLVAGMPWVVKLARVPKNGEPDKMGVYARCHSRFIPSEPGAWGCMYRCQLVVGVHSQGVALKVDQWTMSGYKGWCKVAWNYVVGEGNEYLRDGGELNVTLTVWMEGQQVLK